MGKKILGTFSKFQCQTKPHGRSTVFAQKHISRVFRKLAKVQKRSQNSKILTDFQNFKSRHTQGTEKYFFFEHEINFTKFYMGIAKIKGKKRKSYCI